MVIYHQVLLWWVSPLLLCRIDIFTVVRYLSFSIRKEFFLWLEASILRAQTSWASHEVQMGYIHFHLWFSIVLSNSLKYSPYLIFKMHWYLPWFTAFTHCISIVPSALISHHSIFRSNSMILEGCQKTGLENYWEFEKDLLYVDRSLKKISSQGILKFHWQSCIIWFYLF